MGTYSDSKLVVARNLHECGSCGKQLRRGDRYLRFKLGLRNDIKRCLECACETEQGRLKYDCAVMREYLNLPPAIGRAG